MGNFSSFFEVDFNLRIQTPLEVNPENTSQKCHF